MGGRDESKTPPTPAELTSVFDVYEVRKKEKRVLYVGEPVAPGEQIERELWPLFRNRGYEISLQRGYQTEDDIPLSRGEFVLVAEPRTVGTDGIPRTNLVLFFLTILSTLFAGSVFWYQVPLTEEPWRMIEAWPFVLAIMGVLGVHELGHYVMSRYHDVDASLPYFIPVPTVIGSLGAVIKIKGRIPDRKALFDIGVAGPLAGLVATFVVTAIGLQLDPLAVQTTAEATGDEPVVFFNHPPMLELIAALTGASGQLESGVVHPVVFGGWVGMLVTLLNMIPVGQLDGGHIVRAMFGERGTAIAAAVPGALVALSLYVFYVAGWQSMTIWLIWGVFALILRRAGPAKPIREGKLDNKRMALGVVTFVLAALCFTPVPIEIVEGATMSS